MKTSIIYIPHESLCNILMNYNKFIQNILNDELISYYIFAPNFEKVGDILGSVCPYVCMYVCMYVCR